MKVQSGTEFTLYNSSSAMNLPESNLSPSIRKFREWQESEMRSIG